MRRKSVLLSAMVLGLVGALIAASTAATFSDQAVSDGNTFEAGTLYMSLDGQCGTREYGGSPTDPGVDGNTGCSVTASFTATDMVPGGQPVSHEFTIENLGSLPGTLSASTAVTVDAGHPGCAASNFIVTNGGLSTTSLAANGGADTATYEVSVALDANAPNACQGATGTVTVTFDLVQA